MKNILDHDSRNGISARTLEVMGYESSTKEKERAIDGR
jgi:hypothetical protein